MWYAKLAYILAAVGALNWGLAELGWNLVDTVFGWAGAVVVSIVYYLVALAGLYVLVMAFKK